VLLRDASPGARFRLHTVEEAGTRAGEGALVTSSALGVTHAIPKLDAGPDRSRS